MGTHITQKTSDVFIVMVFLALVFCWNISSTYAVETKKVILLRVYFDDYTANSRYTCAEVDSMMSDMDTLWQNTSYSNIDIDYQVSTLFELPDNRSDYVDDLPACEPDATLRPFGDLSCGAKFGKVLEDAINNSGGIKDCSGNVLNWNNVDLVLVLMAETSNAEFHRGQGTNSKNLPMGPGGDMKNVGAAIFSENPTENDNQIMGRWAHEVGHALQQNGPAHPSNYNNEFELMDSNYPGQTGPFEKMSDIAFPGWLPETKYKEIDPDSGGDNACLWAMEYNPTDKPNYQAIKANITDSLYYLISVRRRVLGDDLNGDFTPFGIPDEGVIIERVSEGANPWVTVMGNGAVGGVCGAVCDRDDLWHDGDSYDGGADGIYITIRNRVDEDNYCVYVTYDDQALQPDVMMNPWRSPPGDTWETTDIWIDSPLNGYDTYRYGKWDDGTGNLVPHGNGDDPAIGQVNRIYARVRNVGFSPATDVEVTWEMTDPPGLGIAGSNGWASLGTVDKTDFPGLASIAAGDFVDVYLNWTPDFVVSEEDMAAGVFNFHTCVRTTLNHVAGETVFGNQDGDDEQENINYFEFPPEAGATEFGVTIKLKNDDAANKKYFYISYEDDIPAGWKVDINSGKLGIELAPSEEVDIPVSLYKDAVSNVGDTFSVNIQSSSMRTLQNDKNSKDLHTDFEVLGGVRLEARVLQRPTLTCEGENQGDEYYIKGRLDNIDPYYDQKVPLQVALEGVDSDRKIIPATLSLVTVNPDGSFEGYLTPARGGTPREGVCLFCGTTELASASSGYFPLEIIGSTTTTTTTDTSTTTTTDSSSTTTVPGICPIELIHGEQSEKTELLRYIRDKVLSQTPQGQELIRLYYEWSPAIAKAMEADEEFKEEVKEMIDGVLEMMERGAE
jgi:hypothetical protein